MSVNTDLNLTNDGSQLSLKDLEGLPSDEAIKILTGALGDLSETDREDWINNLGILSEELEESLFAAIDEIEGEAAGLNDDYLEGRKMKEAEELEELVEILDGLETQVTDANKNIDFKNQTFSANGLVDLTGAEMNTIEPGGKITLEIQNGASLGLGLDEEADTTGLPTYGVAVSINLGDATLQPVSYDATTKTSTFNATMADGKTFTLELVGEGKYSFTGSQYLTKTQIETLHEDQLKMFYDGDKRFYTSLYGADSEEVAATTEMGEEILDDFSKDTAAINELLAASYTLNYGNNGSERTALSSAELADLKNMVLQLLATGTYQTENPISVAEAWEEIWDILGGYEIDRQNALLGALIMLFGKHDNANLLILFPESETSEITEALKYLEYETDTDTADTNIDAFSIAALMVLNDAAGITPQKTLEDLGVDDYSENLVALEFLQSFCPDIATSEATSTQEAEATENPVVTFSNNFGDDTRSWVIEQFYISIPKETRNYYDSLGFSKELAAMTYMGVDRGNISIDTFTDYLDKLLGELNGVPMTKAEFQAHIQTFITGLPADYQDDFTCIFLCGLHDFSPDIFATTIEPTETGEADAWAAMMWDTFANNGGGTPAAYEMLKGYLADEGLIFG